jgi:hypothetical protein
MSLDDLGYLFRRAEQEMKLAQSARNPQVVAVHLRFLELYRERIASARRAAGNGLATAVRKS